MSTTRPLTWSVAFRLRRYLRESLWVIPLVGGMLGWTFGLVSADVSAVVDRQHTLAVLGFDGRGGARRGRWRRA